MSASMVSTSSSDESESLDCDCRRICTLWTSVLTPSGNPKQKIANYCQTITNFFYNINLYKFHFFKASNEFQSPFKLMKKRLMLPELSKVDLRVRLLFPARSGVRSLVLGPSSSEDSESESGLAPGITFLLHTGHVFFLLVSHGSMHLQW